MSLPPPHSRTPRPLRVAQWTTGNVARQAVRAILERPDLELVGAFARSAEKEGVDAGTLCGLDGPIGVLASGDIAALLALDLDCVVYSPLHFDLAEVDQLLRAGVNIVTTAEFLTGANLGPDGQEAVRSAAMKGGATIFGSGMNPGFTQLLGAIAAGMSRGVSKVTLTESVDVGQFVGDANFAAMGWGRPRDDPGHADAVRAGSIVFAEGVDVLAALLGVTIDQHRCDVDFTHATHDLELSGARIASGHVAGIDTRWVGVHEGRDVVALCQRWLASADVDPAWTIDHGYSFDIEGDPSLHLKLDIWPTPEDLADLTPATMHNIGMRITAMPVVNAIPAVCAAAPGIATYADLPVITSRLA